VKKRQIFLFRILKNCFELWLKRWEYCKKLDGDYFGKKYRLLISAALKQF
jgi:hypothetical protein